VIGEEKRDGVDAKSQMRASIEAKEGEKIGEQKSLD